MTESGLMVGRGTHGFTMKNVIIDDFRESKEFPNFNVLTQADPVSFPC